MPGLVNSPVISNGVMTANIIWKLANTVVGIEPVTGWYEICSAVRFVVEACSTTCEAVPPLATATSRMKMKSKGLPN